MSADAVRVGRGRALLRFAASALLGIGFFVLPVPWGGRFTVPFDIVVSGITRNAPRAVSLYCLALVLVGAVGSLRDALSRARAAKRPARPTTGSAWSTPYRAGPMMTGARTAGAILAGLFVANLTPPPLLRMGVPQLMWNTLAFSVGVIIPIGAAFLVLFVRYGFLEFVGTLMRPVMRPLFRLPGRAALDSLTSWVGSYSVGLYLTQRLLRDGYYTKREAYTIATCFSTVSIGFVGVVVQTLDLLPLFPLIFLVYFLAVYVLTALLVRTWPVAGVPDVYVGPPHPEAPSGEGPRALLRTAWRRALNQAQAAPPVLPSLVRGFGDGLLLASTILGSIVAVGTLALLLARGTPVFQMLGRPVVPLLAALGVPDAEIVGPAAIVGITEMYIPALLAQGAAEAARFFVAVLSISQLIFFSSVGPMMLDMFAAIPIRARELVALFLLRTAILIPLLALVTALLRLAGVLA